MENENKCALDTIPGAFAALADAAEKVKWTSDEIRVERMNLPPMFGTMKMKQTNKS
jgi:hypothetical protein